MPSPAMATIRPCPWNCFDDSGFSVRKYFGDNFVEAEFVRYGFCRCPAVARNHHDAHSLQREAG